MLHVKLDRRDSAKLTFSFPAGLKVQDALCFTFKHEFQ